MAAHCVTEEVTVKREAQPNRSAVSFCCLIRRRPVVVVSPPSPYRVYSASPLLLTGRGALILRALNSTRARPRLFQPLPFQRDGGGNDGGGGGGSGGGRAGGRSETRHLKLAPTKTTARRRRRRAMGRSRERASERAAAPRRARARARGWAGVLELPKPSELVQKISSFTAAAAAAAAFGAANYRAVRAQGGKRPRPPALLRPTSGRRSLSLSLSLCSLLTPGRPTQR